MSPSVSWSRLESQIHGSLLQPSNPRFESARRLWNGAVDRRPAAILLCSRASDIIAGVRFAAAEGLKVSVRGGGHNVAGRSIRDGALLLDLSAMRDVHIDARGREAEVAGGATWRELDGTAGVFGLATTGGMISNTGVGGLTLGGGIGWLMRRYGLTVDNLRSAELILADGRQVQVSAEENPDLFWALRGGGGHVGVVTRFVYQLHPVSTVLGGTLWYGAQQARAVLRVFQELNAAAPDELTTLAAASVAPPAPFVPPQLHGKPVIIIGVCWCGDLEAGRKVLTPLRSVSAPEIDHVAPTAYPALQSSLDATAPAGMQNYWSSRFVDQLDENTLDWFAAQALALPTPLSMIHCHQLGGAVSRGDGHDAAAQLRRHPYLINVIGVSPSAGDLGSITAWAHRSVDGFGTPAARTYVNFSAAAGAFPKAAFADDAHQRLQDIKRQYDPSGMFG